MSDEWRVKAREDVKVAFEKSLLNLRVLTVPGIGLDDAEFVLETDWSTRFARWAARSEFTAQWSWWCAHVEVRHPDAQ